MVRRGQEGKDLWSSMSILFFMCRHHSAPRRNTEPIQDNGDPRAQSVLWQLLKMQPLLNSLRSSPFCPVCSRRQLEHFSESNTI